MKYLSDKAWFWFVCFGSRFKCDVLYGLRYEYLVWRNTESELQNCSILTYIVVTNICTLLLLISHYFSGCINILTASFFFKDKHLPTHLLPNNKDETIRMFFFFYKRERRRIDMMCLIGTFKAFPEYAVVCKQLFVGAFPHSEVPLCCLTLQSQLHPRSQCSVKLFPPNFQHPFSPAPPTTTSTPSIIHSLFALLHPHANINTNKVLSPGSPSLFRYFH